MQPSATYLRLPEGLEEKFRAAFYRHLFHHESGCILWAGAQSSKGYGVVGIRVDRKTSRRIYAHRVAWLIAEGEIDDAELVIDHNCRQPLCVNYAHLELVSPEENRRRGRQGRPPRRQPDQVPMPTERCKNGHLWSENAVERFQGKYRRVNCLTCYREAARERYYRKRAAMGFIINSASFGDTPPPQRLARPTQDGLG